MVLLRSLCAFVLLALACLFFASAPTLAQNVPNEMDIEFAILERLPPGASIVSFRHETFADEARGVGRVSVAGSYVLDREYYLTKDGFDAMVEGRAKELGASTQSFIQFWQSVAYDFGGKPWLFKVASVSYRPGRSLNFSGDLNYVRGVDGFRFTSAGMSKEIPQGSSSLESAYVSNSPEYNRIESSYIDFLKQLKTPSTADAACAVPKFAPGIDKTTYLYQFVGESTWMGDVSQPSSSRPYRIVLLGTGERLGVRYPELKCGGNWELEDEISENGWRFTERISFGKDKCTNDGVVDIFVCADGTIKFLWKSQVASEVEASSVLTGYPNP